MLSPPKPVRQRHRSGRDAEIVIVPGPVEGTKILEMQAKDTSTAGPAQPLRAQGLGKRRRDHQRPHAAPAGATPLTRATGSQRAKLNTRRPVRSHRPRSVPVAQRQNSARSARSRHGFRQKGHHRHRPAPGDRKANAGTGGRQPIADQVSKDRHSPDARRTNDRPPAPRPGHWSKAPPGSVALNSVHPRPPARVDRLAGFNAAEKA